MADLKTSVQFIHGIGPQRAKALEKLGIATLGDLISWFPRRYEDRTQIVPIAQLDPDTPACVAAMIAAPPTLSHIRKGMDLVKVRAVDDTGVLEVTFFNQTWLKNQLHEGRDVPLLRPGGGKPPPPPHDVSGRGAHRPPGVHRADRAHLSPDRRGQPADSLPVHPPGAGRMHRHSP